MKRYVFVLFVVVLAGVPTFSRAADLVPYAGLINLDDGADGLFGMEYRHDAVYGGLRPVAGAYIDSDSALYGYGGAVWELPLGERFYLSPGLAVGLYSDGDDHDLGGAIEFRSSVELAYQLDDRMRVGVGIQHLSNAGLYDHNPGTEAVVFNLQIPLGE